MCEKPICFRLTQSEEDLHKILDLQKQNLKQNLDPDEVMTQGFVTVQHSFEQLKNLHELEPHLIAEKNDELAGYLLAMTRDSENEIPVLKPMFKRFGELQYKNEALEDFNYLVVGQVCVAKDYRGKGILDSCYAAYHEFYKEKYDFAITEIAKDNQRSLKAHLRIGFKIIDSYFDETGTEWIVILWDWNDF
ncbi:MAG: GNAT family N-acetyltransferase [Christiangramia sp.]|nr:GNAT family N-acetyltransferase [Christiangramia sp.]